MLDASIENPLSKRTLFGNFRQHTKTALQVRYETGIARETNSKRAKRPATPTGSFPAGAWIGQVSDLSTVQQMHQGRKRTNEGLQWRRAKSGENCATE